jgi:Flp pilus assembly protein TadG
VSARAVRLRGCQDGAAMVEFALIAPVFLMLILGGLDICHTMYVRSVLTGQLQKASRDLSLEDASASTRQDAIEASVETAVRNVMPTATVTLVPTAYRDYANVGNAEEFNDANHNGKCDNKEGFVDSNRNGTWDKDSATAGRGGAKDVVMLTATATYNHLPLVAMFTGGRQVELTAKTLLRNQPNDQQADPPAGVCP